MLRVILRELEKCNTQQDLIQSIRNKLDSESLTDKLKLCKYDIRKFVTHVKQTHCELAGYGATKEDLESNLLTVFMTVPSTSFRTEMRALRTENRRNALDLDDILNQAQGHYVALLNWNDYSLDLKTQGDPGYQMANIRPHAPPGKGPKTDKPNASRPPRKAPTATPAAPPPPRADPNAPPGTVIWNGRPVAAWRFTHKGDKIKHDLKGEAHEHTWCAHEKCKRYWTCDPDKPYVHDTAQHAVWDKADHKQRGSAPRQGKPNLRDLKVNAASLASAGHNANATAYGAEH